MPAKRASSRRSGSTPVPAEYFRSVADARYVLRRVFRIVDEHARSHGLEPLPHQALIQVFGSPRGRLLVRELAERLDVTAAFASMLVRDLESRGLVERGSDARDRRLTPIDVTPAGARLLATIDAEVWPIVDAFTATLDVAGRKVARSVLMFYIGRRRSKDVRTAASVSAAAAYTGAKKSLSKKGGPSCAPSPPRLSPSPSSPPSSRSRPPRSRRPRPSSRSARRSRSTG